MAAVAAPLQLILLVGDILGKTDWLQNGKITYMVIGILSAGFGVYLCEYSDMELSGAK